jgi:hypothetical protein
MTRPTASESCGVFYKSRRGGRRGARTREWGGERRFEWLGVGAIGKGGCGGLEGGETRVWVRAARAAVRREAKSWELREWDLDVRL